MGLRSIGSMSMIVGAVVSLVLIRAAAQVPASPRATDVPRTQDGKPDLTGIWQVMNSAAWDIQDHQARKGVPAGMGVVEGNEIPYQPAALAKKRENFQNRETADPEAKCYLPGVPRLMYMPFPFQIFQTPSEILMVYEYKGSVRTIYMDPHREAPTDSWMGWSNGHWEGDTLVVDVTSFNDHTWFDRAGNYHSDELHVVERYTPISPYHIKYEATIEDPKVFTRPWKISFPLYRRVEENVQLVEFNCVPFVEELMYAPLGLYKPPSK